MKMVKFSGILLVAVLLGLHIGLHAQELYVFTEPASNMPAKSISAKVSGKYVSIDDRIGQRYTPEIMFGLNKLWMVHLASTLSDMYSPNIRGESTRIYAKYRFLSIDGVHEHFRAAAFAEYALSRNKLMYDELALDGDQSGGQAGIILTGLMNRFAISSTLSYLAVTSDIVKMTEMEHPNQAFTYSLSAGFLVLPIRYKAFGQTNLNIYTELLGQRSLDMKRYSVDLAPALQLIFNSNLKINAGYRFQLDGNMIRMARNSFNIGIERTFLSAIARK